MIVPRFVDSRSATEAACSRAASRRCLPAVLPDRLPPLRLRPRAILRLGRESDPLLLAAEHDDRVLVVADLRADPVAGHLPLLTRDYLTERRSAPGTARRSSGIRLAQAPAARPRGARSRPSACRGRRRDRCPLGCRRSLG